MYEGHEGKPACVEKDLSYRSGGTKCATEGGSCHAQENEKKRLLLKSLNGESGFEAEALRYGLAETIKRALRNALRLYEMDTNKRHCTVRHTQYHVSSRMTPTQDMASAAI